MSRKKRAVNGPDSCRLRDLTNPWSARFSQLNVQLQFQNEGQAMIGCHADPYPERAKLTRKPLNLQGPPLQLQRLRNGF